MTTATSREETGIATGAETMTGIATETAGTAGVEVAAVTKG